jgi:hypothetical protein
MPGIVSAGLLFMGDGTPDDVFSEWQAARPMEHKTSSGITFFMNDS